MKSNQEDRNDMDSRNSIERPKSKDGRNRTENAGLPDKAERPQNMVRSKRLRPSGGYRNLRSFQTTTVIYDATILFCDRFMDKRSRTVDQMVQAARSGRQNIAEGSRATATSSHTELRLINVARASLDELLLDYEDFLRQHGLRQWNKDDTEAKAVRAVGMRRKALDQSDRTDRTDREAYSRWLDHKDPVVVVNAIICLIHQANYLLDLQISGLERQFVEGGGYSEQLATARIEKRRKDQTDLSDRSDPTENTAQPCPICSGLMALRTARKGGNAGSQFWGCVNYPKCKGTLRIDGVDRSGGGKG
jgi:restriction system protein